MNEPTVTLADAAKELAGRKAIRELAKTTRQLTDTCAGIIGAMVADDYQIDVALLPFLQADKTNPFRACANQIGYIVKIDPKTGEAGLYRMGVEAAQRASKKLIPAGGEDSGVRFDFLEIEAIPEIDPLHDSEILADEYKVDGTMSTEMLNEFLAHVGAGLMTYVEQTLARLAAGILKRCAASRQAVLPVLEQWQVDHPKPKLKQKEQN